MLLYNNHNEKSLRSNEPQNHTLQLKKRQPKKKQAKPRLFLLPSCLLIIWSASMSVVFKLNFRLQKLNKSSKDGPKRSMTSAGSLR